MPKILNRAILSVVDGYVKGVIPDKNVLSVLLTGSVGRGDEDGQSDIDIVLFVRSLDKNTQQEGKFYFRDNLFDVRICAIQRLAREDWSYEMYFAYLHSKIIYDRLGAAKSVLDKKRKVWDSDIVKCVVLAFVNLSVVVKFEDNWRQLRADTHFEKAVKRGDLKSAHLIIDIGLGLILDLFYLLGGYPPPDAKNKIRLLGMSLFPKYHFSIEDILLIRKIDSVEINRRYNLLLFLVDYLKSIVNTSLESYPDNFYQYYIKNRS